MKPSLHKALEKAVKFALNDVGLDGFKKTSLFLSNQNLKTALEKNE